MNARSTRIMTTALLLLTATSAFAQNFDLSWHTIDGGGEMFTSGGNFELSGTIGQPDAGGITWPTTAVDGTWVNFSSSAPLQFGGYNTEFHSVSTALSRISDGTKLRFKPGSSAWTGTLSTKLRLDAPFGVVRIGAP